ncbi:MAG TPA: FG-GAP repeat protein, partial [bacterium]|nr:FG-GAP repeat protein [bacterium]
MARCRACWSVIIPLLILGLPASAQIKLPHTGGNPGDGFGRSVAIEADTILTGSPFNGTGGAEAGAVYVYHYDGVSWNQSQILIPAAIEPMDYFGYAVALSGDYAAIGATGDDAGGFLTGAVYMYRYDGVTWNPDQKITDSAGDAWDEFGAAVDLSGDDVFIGAPGDDDLAADAGSVFIYHSDGSAWTFSQKLTAGSADDAFGKSISVDGSWAAIGAYGDDTGSTDSGAVYMYRFDGSGWVPYQTLKAGDAGAQDYFGLSVALDGQQLLVGAPYDNDNGADSGSVYVFAYDNNSWTQQEKLAASDGTANH